MLIESLAGLVPVRRRTVALRFGGAMGKPLFGGVRKTGMKLDLSRAFKNGVIVNRYKAG